MKKRPIRSFSATTLCRRASQKVAPPQTDRKEEYFYTAEKKGTFTPWKSTFTPWKKMVLITLLLLAVTLRVLPIENHLAILC